MIFTLTRKQIHQLFLLALLLAAAGCTSASEPSEPAHQAATLAPASLGEGEKLRVVATTSIIADVVANVGRDLIDLTMLMPVGTDPHAFESRPQDVAAVADAHVLFANGLGLEEFLDPLLESAGVEGIAVHLSDGIDLLGAEGSPEHENEDHAGDDPHTWTDPNNIMVWVRNVEAALSVLDPAHAPAYGANAAAYQADLEELDGWIRQQVAEIPEADRQIVTDHSTLNYFVGRYGFIQVGAIIPGYSTLSEPSARELAAMEEAIEELGVKAIFVGKTVNPALAETVAEDTGTRLVFIYTGSLSAKGGDADTYIAYMRYNVDAIVSALRVNE